MYRAALDEDSPASERLRAFDTLKGGFVPQGDRIDTPFGGIPSERIADDRATGARTDRMGVLKNEFSLDSFFSLMSLYAKVQDLAPISVLPIYVGMTREPVSGSFAVAADLARLLRSMRGANTAIVTTGDIVHYGTAYTPKEEMLDVGEEDLEAFFYQQCGRVLSLALEKQDLEGAFRDSNEILRSDQRYILPVIASYLGENGQFMILSFSLSDYSQILNTPRPCVVASALVSYIPPSG